MSTEAEREEWRKASQRRAQALVGRTVVSVVTESRPGAYGPIDGDPDVIAVVTLDDGSYLHVTATYRHVHRDPIKTEFVRIEWRRLCKEARKAYLELEEDLIVVDRDRNGALTCWIMRTEDDQILLYIGSNAVGYQGPGPIPLRPGTRIADLLQERNVAHRTVGP